MRTPLRSDVERLVEETKGILSLVPAWVARDFLPAGRRLGLEEYSVEDKRRGEICERWLGSTVQADNPFGPEDEGLSYLACPDGSHVLLRDLIHSAGHLILGQGSKLHEQLNFFAKLFDYSSPLPFHLHQMEKHATLTGKKPKEEAYYFLEDVPMGAFPYSFFGVHPSIAKPENRSMLIPYLEKWENDEILKFSRAYKIVPGEGFLVPSGTLHAPGTALTLEIQETSDVVNMFTPPAGNRSKSKDRLWKDVHPEMRAKNGLNALLDLVNWEVAGDPYYYEHYHLTPIPIRGPPGGEEFWIFYGTRRFSGKKTVVEPASRFGFQEKGPFTLFVWRGQGELDGTPIMAGADHTRDEFFVVSEAAKRWMEVENTTQNDLVMFKFFGEDVSSDTPALPTYP
jgi:hypothetical protein